MRIRSLTSALLLLGLSAGCCVTPPNAEEILNLGYRSPEQTFATFQAGFRGNLARLEYRCFSVEFRARHQLSQLGYREFREQELSSNPWFRLGIADAKIESSESLGPFRQRIVAESHGYRFELVMIREDSWQLWSSERLLADESLASGGFPSAVDLQPSVGAPPVLLSAVQLPSNLAHLPLEELRKEVTEFRVAIEWKIDSLRQLDDDPPSKSAHPPSP